MSALQILVTIGICLVVAGVAWVIGYMTGREDERDEQADAVWSDKATA